MEQAGRLPQIVQRLGYGRIALICIMLAVGLGLLLAWAAGGEFSGRYAVPDTGHPMAETGQRPAASAPVIPPATTPSPRHVQPAPEETAPVAMDADEARVADTIDHATRKALRRGDTVRWHKDGESGYIVVSEPRDQGDRVCRNVSATIIRGEGQTRSGSHLWCASEDDDDWSPE